MNYSNTVVLQNLPRSTKAEQVAAYLSDAAGLEIFPKYISVPDTGDFSATAFVEINAHALRQFLIGKFADKRFGGRALKIERWEFKTTRKGVTPVLEQK